MTETRICTICWTNTEGVKEFLHPPFYVCPSCLEKEEVKEMLTYCGAKKKLSGHLPAYPMVRHLYDKATRKK